MGPPPPGLRLTFQTKVLLPVLAFLILLPVFTLWIVNRQMTRQVFDEARQRLDTAEGVFNKSLELRSDNLLSRYKNVVNEPRFKAVAKLADSPTMTVYLNELLNEIGDDAEVMLFTTQAGDMLAGAKQSLTVDRPEFAQAAAAAIDQAARGLPSVTTIVFGEEIFNVVSTPVKVDEVLVGALTVGERLGDGTAEELKHLTRTEILLFAGNAIAASTVPERTLQEILREHHARWAPGNERSSDPSVRIVLNREHFLASAGSIGGPASGVEFLLLSSYERQLRTFQDTRNALLWFSGFGIFLSAGVIWFLIRRITQPLRELTAHAEAESFDLVVCDWKMPGLNGIAIFTTAIERDPEVARRFVFMTGDVIAENFKDFLKEKKLPCLPKPFSLHEFHFILRNLGR